MIKSVSVNYISRGMSDQPVIVDDTGVKIASSFDQCCYLINGILEVTSGNIQKLNNQTLIAQETIKAAANYIDTLGGDSTHYRIFLNSIKVAE